MLFVQLDTGLPKTQVQLRKEHSNMSLPLSWNEETLALLNVARVEKTEAPTVGQYQAAYKDGIENVDGVWKEKWKVLFWKKWLARMDLVMIPFSIILQ